MNDVRSERPDLSQASLRELGNRLTEADEIALDLGHVRAQMHLLDAVAADVEKELGAEPGTVRHLAA